MAMIYYDAATGNFYVNDRPPFVGAVRAEARDFQIAVSRFPFSGAGNASPYDRMIAGLPVSAGGTPNGTNLDHHISIDAIQTMVCSYLNGTASAWQLFAFVGYVVTPSWLSITDAIYRRNITVFAECAEATYKKFALALARFRHRPPATLATMANDLCSMLNSARQNLRFGHATTNLSIGEEVDGRVAYGISLEPIAWLERLYSALTGTPVLAPETSAFVNSNLSGVLAHRSGLAVRDNAGAVPGSFGMSESTVQVALTGTGNPIHGYSRAVASPLRGPIPGLTYSIVSRDTLVCLIGLFFLYTYLTNV